MKSHREEEVPLPQDAPKPIQRKPYEPPQLKEWGSIMDLTRGGLGPPPDKAKGGSRLT